MAHENDGGWSHVQLFEKARGLGGRLCHRRSEHGRFYGLQFLHIRDEH